MRASYLVFIRFHPCPLNSEAGGFGCLGSSVCGWAALITARQATL